MLPSWRQEDQNMVEPSSSTEPQSHPKATPIWGSMESGMLRVQVVMVAVLLLQRDLTMMDSVGSIYRNPDFPKPGGRSFPNLKRRKRKRTYFAKVISKYPMTPAQITLYTGFGSGPFSSKMELQHLLKPIHNAST